MSYCVSLVNNGDRRYHGTNSSDRRAADRFLQRLQRESAGWALADAILGGLTPLAPLESFSSQPLGCEALVFAAMTLHVKVCGDLHELSDEQQVQLREATIAHLSRWGGGPSAHLVPPALVKKLALAVAALAVQTGWEDVLAFVEAQLADSGGSEAVTAEAVARTCRVRLVALELLTALPEQCASRRLCVSRARRVAYSQFLKSVSAGALSVITNVVAATSELQQQAIPDASEANVSQAITRLNTRAFTCLHSWMCWSEVHPELVAANPLFLGAFEALSHSQLFDVAADVILEALRAYDCSKPANLVVVRAVAPRIMSLRPRFEQAVVSDDDDALGLARLLCEMGESYMPLIASPQNASEMLAVVDLELCCARHPERKVAGLALRFFYKLSRAWTQMPEDEQGAAAKAHLQKLLVEPYGQLADICIAHARRTDDDGTADEFGRDELAVSEEFVRHRQDIAEGLGDCVLLVGADGILDKIGAELMRVTSADTSSAADGVEACLFALKAIADWVPDTEQRVLPHAMRLVPQLPREWPATVRAGAALIGEYAKWLEVHAGEFLGPLFRFLVAQLETTAGRNAVRAARAEAQYQNQRRPVGGNSNGPSVAAKSLKAVCGACRAQLAAIPSVIDLRDQLGPTGVAQRDQQEVLEGLAQVVAASSSYDALEAGFEKLIQPPATALTAASQAEPLPDPKLVVNELDRLTSIVRCTTPDGKLIERDVRHRPHPVLTAVDRLWPVFEALAERYRGNPNVIERLCRCYKHSMRSCRKLFEPMLKRMIEHLVRHFDASPLSSYVYASSICITEFGNDPSKERVLFEMLTAISRTVFSLFRTIDDFRERPDVVEEYFYLVSRYLDYCPDELVASALLASILQCGLVGLALEHREAQRGVLHCFERTAVVALSAQHQQEQASRRDQAPTPRAIRRIEVVKRLLVDAGLGRDIAASILKSLTGELPAYALDEGHGSLVCVLWKLRQLCPVELPQWCAASLANVPERFASNDVKQDLLNSISNEPPRKEIFCEVRSSSFIISRLLPKWQALLVFSARCRDLARLLR